MDLRLDERAADSPLIERIWYSYTDTATPFTSMANTYSEMVVTKSKGQTFLTIRGPETQPSAAISPQESEFMGIQFKPGAFMPNFPAQVLMNRQDVNFDASQNRFTLNGSSWELPDFENADDFVKRLIREGLLVYDPLVNRVLEGQPVDMTLRTVQRRFLQATGLSLTTMYQIKRARFALNLLKQGTSILDTVEQSGYFDQAHLSKHLKRFTGQTPAQVLSKNAANVVSFLYKTAPF